jgi:hypothetical protein
MAVDQAGHYYVSIRPHNFYGRVSGPQAVIASNLQDFTVLLEDCAVIHHLSRGGTGDLTDYVLSSYQRGWHDLLL